MWRMDFMHVNSMFLFFKIHIKIALTYQADIYSFGAFYSAQMDNRSVNYACYLYEIILLLLFQWMDIFK